MVARNSLLFPGNNPQPGLVSQQQPVQQFYKKQVYDPLDKLGYTGFRSDVKNWGEFGTHPGGPTGAMTDFNSILANAQQTGDLSQIEPFMRGADQGNRKYHRGGLFGTGFNPMPSSILGALGMFAAPFIPGALAGNFGTTAAAGATGAATTGIQGALNAAGMGIASGASSVVPMGGAGLASSLTGVQGATTAGSPANQYFARTAGNVVTTPTLGSLPAGVAQGVLPPFPTGSPGTTPPSPLSTALNVGTPGGTSVVPPMIVNNTTSAATSSLFDKIKDFINTPTGKTLASGATNAALTQIIGGISNITGIGKAQEDFSQLEDDNADPELPAQTQRALDSLEESIRGVDRDAYIKEQMRQFTAGSSAAAGVDSGAYITGLQQVIGSSILELAKFQADGSYNMALVGQNAVKDARLNNENLFATKFELDMFQGANSGAIAGGALNFLFGAGNKEDGEKA